MYYFSIHLTDLISVWGKAISNAKRSNEDQSDCGSFLGWPLNTEIRKAREESAATDASRHQRNFDR